jgi:proline iminopeptidase
MSQRYPLGAGKGILPALIIALFFFGCDPSSTIPQKEPSMRAAPPSEGADRELPKGDPALGLVGLVPKDQLRRMYSPQGAKQGWLKRPGGHALYYEVSGNPQGKPVLFVHGGPGSNVSEDDRRWFDPQRYRIILFEQRGCNRSRPSLSDLQVSPSLFNGLTNADLVADIEALRQELKVDRWVVFGGSWGSTLSLAYAEAHPERIIGLVLRGIFLGTQEENEVIYYTEAKEKYPEAWDLFFHFPRSAASPNESIWDAYRAKVMADDLDAIAMWSMYESYITFPEQRPAWLAKMKSLLTPHSRNEVLSLLTEETRPTAVMQILLFPDLEDNYRLADPQRLAPFAHRPIYIVQGAQDDVCPPRFADLLVQALVHAGGQPDYKKVPQASHSPYGNEQMIHWLISATDALRGAP